MPTNPPSSVPTRRKRASPHRCDFDGYSTHITRANLQVSSEEAHYRSFQAHCDAHPLVAPGGVLTSASFEESIRRNVQKIAFLVRATAHNIQTCNFQISWVKNNLNLTLNLNSNLDPSSVPRETELGLTKWEIGGIGMVVREMRTLATEIEKRIAVVRQMLDTYRDFVVRICEVSGLDSGFIPAASFAYFESQLRWFGMGMVKIRERVEGVEKLWGEIGGGKK